VSEIVALVDPSGLVVGSEQRSVVRRDNLLHGATAVLVRSSAGAIYVHRRSPVKDWAPDRHDAAAGGVLRPDEDPRESAARELAEELGIVGAALRPLGLNRYEDEATRCVEHCFETVWDGEMSFRDAEVVWGAWMSLPELGGRLADTGWPFVPDTRQLLGRLARDRVGDYPALGRGVATSSG
jgi:8-oxo-dGTP pyrophosphatase MutT (NUDIX family)